MLMRERLLVQVGRQQRCARFLQRQAPAIARHRDETHRVCIRVDGGLVEQMPDPDALSVLGTVKASPVQSRLALSINFEQVQAVTRDLATLLGISPRVSITYCWEYVYISYYVGCMNWLLAINQPSGQCRGRFTVPSADLSAPIRINLS